MHTQREKHTRARRERETERERERERDREREKHAHPLHPKTLNPTPYTLNPTYPLHRCRFERAQRRRKILQPPRPSPKGGGGGGSRIFALLTTTARRCTRKILQKSQKTVHRVPGVRRQGGGGDSCPSKSSTPAWTSPSTVDGTSSRRCYVRVRTRDASSTLNPAGVGRRSTRYLHALARQNLAACFPAVFPRREGGGESAAAQGRQSVF